MATMYEIGEYIKEYGKPIMLIIAMLIIIIILLQSGIVDSLIRSLTSTDLSSLKNLR